MEVTLPGFNSKLVRLKGVLLQCLPKVHQQRFNSKLVRLKVVWTSGGKAAELTGFNSKLVRLKGLRLPIAIDSFLLRFNSKLVRLKDKLRPRHSTIRKNVSIPNWCD